MTSQSLYRKWRSQKFGELIGQEPITRTLKNALSSGKPAHAYLFTGPRGTGKTSVARILFRAVNCRQALEGDPCNVCPLCQAALDGRDRFGDIVRFTADVLNGVPSIVIGIVAYAIVVLAQGHFSALAGGLALAIMMVPTISRTTEEMLLLVPQALREAALGLGIPRWRTTLSITLRTATSGVITGIMLAFARVAGETAPLLFTALGNQFWNLKVNQPTAALPLQIYTYALSPYDDWHRQAWAGAFVLIVLIVTSVAAVRFAVRRGTFGAA